MILTGLEIIRQQQLGQVRIEPFDSAAVTTNSYDLRLGGEFLRYTDEVLDVRKPLVTSRSSYKLGETVALRKGDFLLGHSIERVGSNMFVPILHARSGIARLGLFVHVTADLIDIGSFGQITFQLFATRDVQLIVGGRIAQITFWRTHGDIKLYSGKYQGSMGPRASEIYKEFKPMETGRES
jgi:dCTP deaminase